MDKHINFYEVLHLSEKSESFRVVELHSRFTAATSTVTYRCNLTHALLNLTDTALIISSRELSIACNLTQPVMYRKQLDTSTVNNGFPPRDT